MSTQITDHLVFHRRVIVTDLDPVPRPWRSVPGHLVLARPELERFLAGDDDAFKFVAELCRAEDAAESRGIVLKFKRRRR